MDGRDQFRTLYLSPQQLRDVRDALRAKILVGLATDNTEIKALPAYLTHPLAPVSGDAVALDAGGTHVRAGLVTVDAGIARVRRRCSDDALMRDATTPGRVNARRFFESQAKLVSAVSPRADVPLGYCFSYPAEITQECEARLLAWTKGISIDDVVGTSVGSALGEALRKTGRRVGRIPVINDTVGSLLAGAFVAPGYARYIGLIVGTGTNMAAFFPTTHISKLRSTGHGAEPGDGDAMAVNLESGNFIPPHLTEYDHALDEADARPARGAQRFEKAVAGAYVPRLLRLVVGEAALLRAGFRPANLDAASVAELRARPDTIGAAATAIINRSADLVAAAAAGVIDAFGPRPGRIGILAEGSVFLRTPGYGARVERTLIDLLPRGATARFLSYPRDGDHPEPTLLGAACAALQLRREPRV